MSVNTEHHGPREVRIVVSAFVFIVDVCVVYLTFGSRDLGYVIHRQKSKRYQRYDVFSCLFFH
jgi:hypothetical protein